MRQDKGEASEDFLDRLSREYRRGWAHERSQTVRDQLVLNVFMLGLSDENLATSLQVENSKPSYVGHPPSVNELNLRETPGEFAQSTNDERRRCNPTTATELHDEE